MHIHSLAQKSRTQIIYVCNLLRIHAPSRKTHHLQFDKLIQASKVIIPSKTTKKTYFPSNQAVLHKSQKPVEPFPIPNPVTSNNPKKQKNTQIPNNPTVRALFSNTPRTNPSWQTARNKNIRDKSKATAKARPITSSLGGPKRTGGAGAGAA